MANTTSRPRAVCNRCVCAAAAQSRNQSNLSKTNSSSAHEAKKQSRSSADAMRAYLQLLDARVAELEYAELEVTTGRGGVGGISDGEKNAAVAAVGLEVPKGGTKGC